jgi:hypothetical protein
MIFGTDFSGKPVHLRKGDQRGQRMGTGGIPPELQREEFLQQWKVTY